MPIRLRATRRPEGGDPVHSELGRHKSLLFPARHYYNADAEGEIIVYRGLLLATVSGGVDASDMTTAQDYYVPYSPGAIYGTGSDTCVGVLRDTLYNCQLTDHQIDAVNRGDFIEKHCYVQNPATVGTVPAAAKTNLTLVKWV